MKYDISSLAIIPKKGAENDVTVSKETNKYDESGRTESKS